MDIDTFGANNVHKLDLAYNELKKIPQHAFSSIQGSLTNLNLRVLSILKWNRLLTTIIIRLTFFGQYEYSIIEGNRIRSINANDFDGLENLTELILADNHIETIEEAAFSRVQKLIKLDISHNPITSWNPHAFRVTLSNDYFNTEFKIRLD